jgi:[ribosomal protein S5]-alanine N-acetyltransferase
MPAGLQSVDRQGSDDAWSLESARLLITTWQLDDLPAARQLWGDPRVMHYLDARGALDDGQVEEKLRQEIERQRRHGVQYWKLLLKATRETIGCCGLRPPDARRGIYELGFHIMAAHWRQGYASEAAATVVRYAFGVMHLPTLVAGHHPGNTGSRAILASLGFQYLGDVLYAPTGLYHPSYELRPGDEGVGGRGNREQGTVIGYRKQNARASRGGP